MIIKMRIAIDPSKIGFRRFLKSQIINIKNKISDYENFPNYSFDIEVYAEALKVYELYELFLSKINSEERFIVKYINYHTPIEKEPTHYHELVNPIYQKWYDIFFNANTYKEGINEKRIGKVMRMIIIYNNRSASELARILGVNRSTVVLHENSDRIPKLNYLYKFCKLFNLKIDDLIKLVLDENLSNKKENKP